MNEPKYDDGDVAEGASLLNQERVDLDNRNAVENVLTDGLRLCNDEPTRSRFVDLCIKNAKDNSRRDD
jgi:hypothetical protein